MEEPAFALKDFLDFAITYSEGRATGTLTLGDQHMNPNLVAHGGVCFTLMDTAMGGAVMTTLEEGLGCATIEMQTRFHRGVHSGTLTAVAEVMNAGRRIAHVEARTTDSEGRLVASATASFAIIDPR